MNPVHVETLTKHLKMMSTQTLSKLTFKLMARPYCIKHQQGIYEFLTNPNPNQTTENDVNTDFIQTDFQANGKAVLH